MEEIVINRVSHRDAVWQVEVHGSPKKTRGIIGLLKYQLCTEEDTELRCVTIVQR